MQFFPTRTLTLALLLGCVLSSAANAQYAASVIQYTSGSGLTAPYSNPVAALGPPERFTGEGIFPGIVSPFNPAYGTDELVRLGEGDSITLKLSHYVIPSAGPELGVFVNVGFSDANYPSGQAETPARTLSEAFLGVPEDAALVEVSEDGLSWSSLGSHIFNIPSNGYTDLTDPYSGTSGSALSDFQQPFTGTLSSFDGLEYAGAGFDMLDLLAGSGGGTWLDISATGLPKVGYVRFSVLDDLDAQTNFNFELDGVSIARSAQGAAVPEPATSILVICTLMALLTTHFFGRSASTVL